MFASAAVAKRRDRTKLFVSHVHIQHYTDREEDEGLTHLRLRNASCQVGGRV